MERIISVALINYPIQWTNLRHVQRYPDKTKRERKCSTPYTENRKQHIKGTKTTQRHASRHNSVTYLKIVHCTYHPTCIYFSCVLDVRSDRNFMVAGRHSLDQGCHISITALGTASAFLNICFAVIQYSR